MQKKMIQIGDRLPDCKFRVLSSEGKSVVKTTQEIFKNKKIVLFGLPGAFTPVCHRNQLPGYLEFYDQIRAKGVDKIMVTSVNDAFVMDAWEKSTNSTGKIEFLADGNGEFAEATGLGKDFSESGMGLRSLRYAMIIEDSVVKNLLLEESPAQAQVSGAENILNYL